MSLGRGKIGGVSFDQVLVFIGNKDFRLRFLTAATVPRLHSHLWEVNDPGV